MEIFDEIRRKIKARRDRDGKPSRDFVSKVTIVVGESRGLVYNDTLVVIDFGE